MAEQARVGDGVPRVDRDSGDAGLEQLPPQAGTQVETGRALLGTHGAARQMFLHVGLHVGGHLVVVSARGRTEEGADGPDPGAEFDHCAQGGGHDADPGADAARMDPRDHTGVVVAEEYRDAVGGQHGEGETGRGRDQRVGGGHRLGNRSVDHGDVATVDLFHPDHRPGRHPDLLGQPNPVRRHGFRIVSDVITEIERIVR